MLRHPLVNDGAIGNLQRRRSAVFDPGQSLGQHNHQYGQDRSGQSEGADDLPCRLCQKQMLRNIVRRTKMLPHLFGRGTNKCAMLRHSA
jgi:hypothetical protein